MRRLVFLGALLAILSLVASPADAVVYGAPDRGNHPEVGALLARHAYSDGTWEACTGTLISSTVFLTAAHCDLGVSKVAVTFDSVYDAKGTTYWGAWHADPLYNQSTSDPHDIAVVVLEKAVKAIAPARLPAAHSLDSLDGTATFTSVGYGAQAVTNGPGGKEFHYADIRYVATGTLNSLNK